MERFPQPVGEQKSELPIHTKELYRNTHTPTCNIAGNVQESREDTAGWISFMLLSINKAMSSRQKYMTGSIILFRTESE